MSDEKDFEVRPFYKDAMIRFNKNKAAVVSLYIIIFYTIASFIISFFPNFSYRFQVLEHTNLPPALFSRKTAGELMYAQNKDYFEKISAKKGCNGLCEEEKKKLSELEYKIEHDRIVFNGKEINPHKRIYIFGTDGSGRDLFARTVYGGQVSIMIGIVGTFFSMILGVVLGSMAGYFGGVIDSIITKVIDVLYSIPYMIIVIILMSVLGRSTLNLFIALSLISWLTVARVVRGQIMSLKHKEFVESAISMGARRRDIIFKHLLPNMVGIIIVYSALRIPSFIIQEAFLSFLGLGVQPPIPSWGSLVRDGISGLTNYPWRVMIPGVTMAIFLSAANFLSDGLAGAFDPNKGGE